ncbi:MAG: D-alanine--D-alanine ligase [Candidatus Omnitrophica bacterium]|nr:D-alanine--D-alanine ligase [Candidatus Omnitrophota bacterium]
MKAKGTKKIGVLAGGTSSEREISLESGKAVYKALKDAGFNVLFLDIRDDAERILKTSKINVAFIALHGRFGEDGTVQAILEKLSIPYTGSDPRSSRLAMDKILSKKLFIKHKLPVPDYITLDEKQVLPTQMHKQLGMPLVFKPHNEGSSIGLSVVRRKTDIAKALKLALQYSNKIIVEKFIKGREVTVGIFDDKPLPVIEILPEHGLYDYSAKYIDKKTSYEIPAKIDKKSYDRAQRLATSAHNACGCKDFSRVDMRMSESGNLYVLEVNTIPGLTERSLLPKAARAAGIDFKQLCIRLVNRALDRKGERHGRIKKEKR